MSRQVDEVRLDEVLTKKIDQVTPYLKYIGRSNFNEATSDAKWQILRITIVGGVMTQEYALKGSYTAIWDDRSSYFGAFTPTAAVQGTLAVTSAATPLRVGAANLDDRKLITLYNGSGVTIYWGWTSDVTTATGFPIAHGSTQLWADDGDVDTMAIDTIYLIAASGSNTVRIAEKP